MDSVLRKFQKHILLGLVLCGGMAVIAAGTFYWVWNAKKAVCDAQMETYGETYLRRYKHLVQSKVLPAYQKHFPFLKEKTFLIKAYISNSHGAAVEFIPSEEQKFQCQTVTARIERELFLDKDLNISKIEDDTSNATFLIYNGKPGPMFRISGKNITLTKFTAITNKGWFLNLLETGSLRIKEISVDNIVYPNTTIMKGSNRRKTWSRKAAEGDAIYCFFQDFWSAYFKSDEFREFVATPELTHIANRIIAKENANGYQGEYGYLVLQEDLAELNAAADAHGIKHEFAKNIYTFLKGQRSWRERHWIICGVIIGVLTCCLIWVLKRSWIKLGRYMIFWVYPC